jgi:hypothetical protein
MERSLDELIGVAAQLVKKFLDFLKSKLSQEPATGPYPEPHKSNRLTFTFFKIRFNIIHPWAA